MKILHILDHTLPVYDGYSFRTRNILHCQQGAGFEVAVVTSSKHEASLAGECASEDEIDGVRHYRAGTAPGPAIPFVGEWRLMRVLEQRIHDAARKERPDFLQAHSPVLNAIPALRAGRRLGIPVVYEIRAYWEDAAADQGTYGEGSLKYRMVRGLETWACRRVDRLVTICQGLRDELLGRGIPEGRVTIVPNAVRAGEFQPVPADASLQQEFGLNGKQVLGFLGSFYRWEGLDLLVEAVALLRHDLPKLRVLLVGGGDAEPELREQCRKLGVEKQVLFAGRLPHERMPGVYSLVDVLVYPRKKKRLTDLVTPLKPLEAMAMGKAMVASDVGGHRELIQDGVTGVLHRADDSEDLARKIRELLADSERRLALGVAGRSWVERERTWDRNGLLYQKLYKGLADGRLLGPRAPLHG